MIHHHHLGYCCNNNNKARRRSNDVVYSSEERQQQNFFFLFCGFCFILQQILYGNMVVMFCYYCNKDVRSSLAKSFFLLRASAAGGMKEANYNLNEAIQPPHHPHIELNILKMMALFFQRTMRIPSCTGNRAINDDRDDAHHSIYNRVL